MAIRYMENGRYRKLPVVRALLAANLAFAILILLAWQMALIVVLGPLGWAVDHPIPSARTLENFLTYPLVLFWAGPAMAMAVGWMLLQARRYKAAFGVLVTPVLVTVLLAAVYIILPHVGA
jgi:uncharacterized membrane protein